MSYEPEDGASGQPVEAELQAGVNTSDGDAVVSVEPVDDQAEDWADEDEPNGEMWIWTPNGPKLLVDPTPYLDPDDDNYPDFRGF